ncbi:hypothetical protein RND71_020983 [Anisodus tanguticus]|uniref:tRNA ligase phosphodiesterase domain-containing protein n=1 Tax=Anisodus tanguticus TaxID=243964 RepID=A0AAE1RUF1_9SOLA|nr:hypothetical protein RND71_020983 [Anisodus tanguticus]
MQRRGGYKEKKKWQMRPSSDKVPGSSSNGEPVSAATTEAITNRLNSLNITESSAQSSAPVASLQFGSVGLAPQSPVQHQKVIWKPKSYGTASGAPTVEAEKTPNNSTFSRAQLRATFYPKFENEKSDQEIRTRMIDMVSKGFAVVEVSLKHSGSLFMYAGHPGGAYAKNSFGNMHVGYVARTLQKCFWVRIGSSKSSAFLEDLTWVPQLFGESEQHSLWHHLQKNHPFYTSVAFYIVGSSITCYTAVGVFVLGRMFREARGTQANKKQAEFNEFLERNRMCISMELVTAVLGDHRQRPRDDYGKPLDLRAPRLIPRAVVTAVTELENGKPKLYSTPDVIAFCREWRLPTNHVWLFSTRKSVTSFFAAFDSLCEEGTATSFCEALDEVADISVPDATVKATVTHRRVICLKINLQRSKDHIKVQGEILEGLVARMVKRESSEHMERVLRDFPPPPLEGEGLDLGPTLREICAANRSEKQQIKALLQSAGTAFCPNYLDWFGDEDSGAHSKNADRSVVSKFLQSHPAHFSTKKLQLGIFLLKQMKSEHTNHGWHQPGLWPLYRGFFGDLDLFKVNENKTAEMVGSSNQMVKNEEEDSSLADEDANLMVKLKFLTYKHYNQSRKMKIWNTSAAKQRELSKMLDEWAVYIRRKYGNIPLSSSTYLSEAEPFLEQYAKLSPQNQALIGSAGNLVRVEDFMVIVEGEDEEGDLEPTKDIAPSSPSISTKDMVAKNEGLIVFFPGIPGCAKSALCKEILNAPGGLGDDRPVHSLMGDLIKGRYWQKVADERRKKPYSIMLADKNAPNEEVSRQIENMCLSTKASAIPVIPDSEVVNSHHLVIFLFLGDETELPTYTSGFAVNMLHGSCTNDVRHYLSLCYYVTNHAGTETNPFSVDALAVFTFRVLHRVNHPGNLDKSSPNAGYVMLMFYHLYDGKIFPSSFANVVKVSALLPYCGESPLPDSVRSIIEEGINLYKLHTNKHGRLESTKGTYAKEWVKWEKQLRDILFGNADYLISIQVPFEFAVKGVLEQLKAIARGEYAAPSSEKRKLGAIVFAAISLPVPKILGLLNDLVVYVLIVLISAQTYYSLWLDCFLAQKDPKVGDFLKDKSMENYIQKAHLTLAHKRSHAVTAVANYGSFLHQKVPVEVGALLFSDKLAALQAEPDAVEGEKVNSKNQWPHVTLWIGDGVAAKDANTLPQLLSQGKATRIDINPPVSITGTRILLKHCM